MNMKCVEVSGQPPKMPERDKFKAFNQEKIQALASDNAINAYRNGKFTFNYLENFSADLIKTLTVPK